MNKYEKQLIDNGFSLKDIDRLKNIIERDKYQKDSLQSLVNELSKRFWGGVISLTLLVSIFLYGLLKDHQENLASYVIVINFGLVIIYFVTPLNLAWKAYNFIRKSNG